MPLFETYSPGTPVIASFPANDIASGIGYVTYYSGRFSDTDALVQGTEMDSDEVRTAVTGLTSTSGNRLNLDFDLLFDSPRLLEGPAFVAATTDSNTTPTSGWIEAYLVINIYHVNSAGGETLLVTETTDTKRATALGFTALRYASELVIPRTAFTNGEKLRININVWAARQGASQGACYLYHEASNRGASEGAGLIHANEPTGLPCKVPYVPNL